MSTFIRRGLAGAAKVAVFGSLVAAALPQTALASAHCANANTAVAHASSAKLKAAVVCLINHQRTSRGLPRLHANRKLNRSAQNWTNTMVRKDEFTHGLHFWTRISAVGFNWSTVGENIAVGYTTPWSVVQAWMASPDHCQNILYPTFSQVGTGVLNKGIGGYGGAATWTQDFALHMGSRAPSHKLGPANGCPYNG
jgi:uncharacterized protein YkwD